MSSIENGNICVWPQALYFAIVRLIVSITLEDMSYNFILPTVTFLALVIGMSMCVVIQPSISELNFPHYLCLSKFSYYGFVSVTVLHTSIL